MEVKLTQREKLAGMAYALEQFNAAYAEMSVQQMRVFITVARREKATGAEIAKALNISSANVSRCVAVLSDVVVARRKSASLGLCALEVDPLDRRVRHVVLTEKGKALVEQLGEQF